jgi:transposase InsO family protein
MSHLFLHYALDARLRRHMRSVRFCRYADDGVIHCKNEAQAKLVLRKLADRLRQCGLELHLEKTRIVHCQDVNRQERYPVIQFTFLGHTFRPRKAVDKYGQVYVNFSPAISREAIKAMRQTVRGWHLQLKRDKELRDLANMFGPILRGWSNYYGRFYVSVMKPLWRSVNECLVRCMQRKYKRLARGVIRASRVLGGLAERAPRSFVHWELGFIPAARGWGPDELRGSRPVLRGAGAAMPRPSQPYILLAHGFAYLVAVIDWPSRRVLSWRISSSMESAFCVDCLEKAIRNHGTPQIFNTDQGSQFTSDAFTGVLKREGIVISMYGRGRAFDNIFVERLWRNVKHEDVYLKGYGSMIDLTLGLTEYFAFYNGEDPHQSLGYKSLEYPTMSMKPL